jgi:hypothetical protein
MVLTKCSIVKASEQWHMVKGGIWANGYLHCLAVGDHDEIIQVHGCIALRNRAEDATVNTLMC